MPYLIIAALLVLIIGLVIVFRVVKKKKPEDQPVPADISGTESIEEVVAAPETEPSDAVAAEDESTEEQEVETVEAPETEEEFVELSLEAEAGDDEEFVELSLDMEEKEPAEDEEGRVEKTVVDQEAADVVPALADSSEESDLIIDEEAPEELTEKLDYYFGGDEDISETVEEEEAEADEEEIVLEEPVVAAETVEVEEEIVEAEAPPRIDREGFEAKLRDIESEIRQQLKDGRGNNDVDFRSVLELRLLTVCEKLASIEDLVHSQEELIEDAKSILAELQDESLRNEMPGVDVREAEKQLHLGNYEEVEKVLGDGILQLDHMSDLVARVYYLCGQLAEERIDYESAFEDYRNALAANDENEECLLAAGRIARILGNEEESRSWLEKLVRQGIEQNVQSLVQAVAQHELALLCVSAGEK
ncbi:MAG: tetratricopeptide repeat protein, partial [bacterium]